MDATDVDERGLHVGGADGRPDVVGADPFGLLVEAKLAVPSVRHGVVDRPRITGRSTPVRGGADAVAAPAGYGKTTAVRAWCAEPRRVRGLGHA